MLEAVEFESIPTRIKAIRYTGGNVDALHRFGVATQIKVPEGKLQIWVDANKSWLPIEPGEWVAEDDHGFYPIKHDVMVRKYKPVVIHPFPLTGEVGQKFERNDG